MVRRKTLKKLKTTKSKLKDKIIAVWKPIGLTPLQAINRLREKELEYGSIKIGYAGRLDPLAEGVLPLMVGKANKNRSQYLNWAKQYEVQIVFGVSTDSHDILGRIQNISDLLPQIDVLKNVLTKFEGNFIQAYPVFSSPILAGRKSFSKQVRIDKIKLLTIEKITGRRLEQEIVSMIGEVKGNFRQSLILADWGKYFSYRQSQVFIIAKVKVDCSAGVYIRLLAHNCGLRIGCPACLLKLRRLSVGNYGLNNCLGL